MLRSSLRRLSHRLPPLRCEGCPHWFAVASCRCPVRASAVLFPVSISSFFLRLLSVITTVVRFVNHFSVRVARFFIIHLSVSRIRHALSRTEERRVGKECRSRWSPYP